MQINGLDHQNLWIACIDLLGTRDLLKKGELRNVLRSYEFAVDSLEREKNIIPSVKYVWFSDTFLLIAPDNSGKSFTEIDIISRRFSSSLLRNHIPLRGGIACGPMYADFQRGIYCGSAMVEAYEYGEAQDWIGLILCPSAKSQLLLLDIDPDHRLNWQKTSIPWKCKSTRFPDQLPAYIFGQNTNGSNACLDALKRMRATIAEDREEVCEKYSRAIHFVENNSRRIVQTKISSESDRH